MALKQPHKTDEMVKSNMKVGWNSNSDGENCKYDKKNANSDMASSSLYAFEIQTGGYIPYLWRPQ